MPAQYTHQQRLVLLGGRDLLEDMNVMVRPHWPYEQVRYWSRGRSPRCG
jgi:hypothetical protein